MTDVRYPAMWRIWGTRRYGLARLPRYWVALVACRLYGHRWQTFNHSDRTQGCGRCSHREPML